MMHMKLGVQNFTEWLVRFISIYLFLFWGVLYLEFSLNIEVGPLAFRDILKAVILGAIFGVPLLISTFLKKIRLSLGLACLLVVMSGFYGHMILEKWSFTFLIGCLGHIIGFVYLFKFKILRRKA